MPYKKAVRGHREQLWVVFDFSVIPTLSPGLNMSPE